MSGLRIENVDYDEVEISCNGKITRLEKGTADLFTVPAGEALELKIEWTNRVSKASLACHQILEDLSASEVQQVISNLRSNPALAGEK